MQTFCVMSNRGSSLTRKRMMLELTGKNVLIVLIFGGFYAPMSVGPMLRMPVAIQESVISLMGFLMTATIIGAFELSYTRTNLDDKLQRYLAHFTKFVLYSSIMLLMQIALMAIQVGGTEFFNVMILASAPICIALVLYDFWDALRALDDKAIK
jgi:hypothetical protein